MKTIIVDEISKITGIKSKLEKLLKIKISIKKEEVSIEGIPDDEYFAEQVIEAIDFGFPLSVAILIKTEDFTFEVLNIKNYTHRKDLESIRARIIGTGGGTFRTLSDLTECHFQIKNNEVGIIGAPEYIKNASDAIISIIRGSKQANVYAFLEKHKIPPVLDLGLKEQKPKKTKKRQDK